MGRGRRLDRAFAHAARTLSAADRGFVHELTFGVSRLRGRLDHLLSLHVTRELDQIDPVLLDILRMGVYQIAEMDGTPHYAAVSQSVEHAKAAVGEGPGRFANGVLRSLLREGWDVARFPAFDDNAFAHLTTWGSHPQWLVARWLDRWDPGDVAGLVNANNRIPPLSLRPIGMSVERAEEELLALGFAVERGLAGSGVLEVAAGAARVLEALQALPVVVQDAGSAAVVAYTQPASEWIAADLCAAPGGKALGLAGSVGRLVAADRSRARIRLLRSNLDRVSHHLAREGFPPLHVDVVIADAEAPPIGRVDLVLLDAPCSGTGTLRRHPDARWRIDPDTPARMARLQARMLEAAADSVAENGVLVYSTCTLEPEENQERVEAFLGAHPEYRIDPPGSGLILGNLDASGCLMVLPQITGTDGAFAARLRRVA